MKKFINEHRNILKETFCFFIFVVLFVVVLTKLGYWFGSDGDFRFQHIRFIDYLRNSFFNTHDLAPQMNMNFGGTQNMATLFYHGQYNPLIMLSYLFPLISTINWLRILFILLSTSSFLAMSILLKQHDIRRVIRVVVSFMTALAMPFLFHNGNHLMFIYYYPIMIVSLIAIRMIIKDKKMWLFIICIALIFYTNFFFALIIGFMQLMYFIVCLYYENDFSKAERIKRYQKLFIGYLIGIMIGALIMLPQVFLVLQGSRAGDVERIIPFFYDNWLQYIITNRYSSALGVIIPLVSIISILNYKNKFNLILIVAVLLCIVLGPFNYLLNVFQYLHNKLLIYTIPIVMLVLARILNNRDKGRQFGIVLGFVMLASLGVVYFDTTQVYAYQYDRYLLMLYVLIQSLILFILYYQPKRKIFLSLFAIIIFVILAVSNPNYLEKEVITKNIEHKNITAKNYYLDKQDDFYRTITDLNYVRAINEYSPATYVSLPIGDQSDFNYHTIEREYLNSRTTSPQAYKNALMRNIFGINTYVGLQKGKEIKFDNIRPFIYGVNNRGIYSQNSLDKQSKFERLFSLNEHVYKKTSNKIPPKKNYHIKNIIDDKTGYMTEDLNKKVFKIPSLYQKNGLIIVKVEERSDLNSRLVLKVNSHPNYFFKTNAYGERPHQVGYYFFDASKKLNKLTFNADQSKLKIGQIKVDYIAQKDLDNNFMKDYIKASNIKIDSNKAYNFDINMKEDGMLATSIFYDKGFNIMVDGKKVTNEKINYNFLGANLDKGQHHVKITYTMPGFKAGLAISFVGFFILAFIMVDEIKWLNKPFFRFVIVGVFNTVNYFIMFTVLNQLGVEYVLAHLCAFLYSATVSYFLTTYYTFKAKPSLKTMLSFPITYLPNLLLSTFGTIILVENKILNESVASLVVMILSIPITFIISKVIFSKKNKE